MPALWNELAARAGIGLSEAKSDALSKYLDLLLEANQKFNLTRISDRAGAEVQHVGDALTLLPFLPREAFRLADVGSGGGVPGIPLAIARPDARVTLIESTQKKANFLREAAGALGLGNVVVISDRVEVVAHGAGRESFDVVTARALAAMNVLAEWCLPLVKKGGKLLAMKGARVSEELPAAEKAVRTLNGGTPVVHAVELPGAEHHVVVEVLKMGRTDSRYPRPAAQTKSKPL